MKHNLMYQTTKQTKMSDELRPAKPFTEDEFREFVELYYQTKRTGMSYKASLEPEDKYCRLFATAAMAYKLAKGYIGIEVKSK